MNLDSVVDVSSEKVYLHHLRQCCSPGSYCKSNNVQDNATCQMLSVVNASDSRHVPWVLRNELLRGTHVKYQIVKALMRKPCSELDIVVPQLRQRQVQDVVEHMLASDVTCVSNVDLGSACFVHHVHDVLNGKCDCSNAGNVFAVRHETPSDENGLKEISNFKSFADENAIFFASC